MSLDPRPRTNPTIVGQRDYGHLGASFLPTPMLLDHVLCPKDKLKSHLPSDLGLNPHYEKGWPNLDDNP